jgi:hypothetical protein
MEEKGYLEFKEFEMLYQVLHTNGYMNKEGSLI